MARIQELLEGRNEKIDYNGIISRFPWIVEREKNCILSPDSDGFLCGLLVSYFLDWEIKGFYDGKVLIIAVDVKPENCIFLDMDINRTCIKSVGHHMVTYNRRLSPPNSNYNNCIQPNILRNFDGKKEFNRKYPLGTIHLLLGLLQRAKAIKNTTKDSIWPLLFTDGVWENLFRYTENCLEWINYLGINDTHHILNPIFCGKKNYSYYIMLGINDFLRMRDSFNAKGRYLNEQYKPGGHNKRTGDKLRISQTNNAPLNLEVDGSVHKIHRKEKERIEGFITSMSKYLEWNYLPQKWTWENLQLFQFTKDSFSSRERKLNNVTYMEMMDKNPLSLAMTSGSNIEYTLEEPDRLGDR